MVFLMGVAIRTKGREHRTAGQPCVCGFDFLVMGCEGSVGQPLLQRQLDRDEREVFAALQATGVELAVRIG